jgi:predicted PolB exonuclease-like 3'-5' exonuclease
VIIALDIEAIPSPENVALLPEPKPKANLKDPKKIAEDIAEKKAAQSEKAALNPLTARVACFALVGGDTTVPTENGNVLPSIDDDGERAVLQDIFRTLGLKDVRLVTWNGIGFDLPMIYKRALILGVDPGSFGAPPLTAWTKRYSTDRHYDLMQIWGGWSEFPALEIVAALILKETREDIPYAAMPELLKTETGRAQILEGCQNHTALTWKLFERFNGFLFA